MPISPYLLGYTPFYANPQVQLEQVPVEEMKALNASEASNYYINQARTLDMMKQAHELAVREPDNAKVKEYYEGLQNRLGNYIENNNYDDVGNVLDSEVMNFQNNHDLQGAIKSKQLEDNFREQLAKGGYNEEQINHALQKARLANQAPVTFNDKLWKYENMFKGELPAQDVSSEMITKLSDYASGIKPNINPVTFENGLTLKRVGGQTYQLVNGDEKALTQKEVRDILDGVIESNPKYTSYLKNMAEVRMAGLTKYDENGNVNKVNNLSDFLNHNGYKIETENDLNKALDDFAYKQNGFSKEALDEFKRKTDDMPEKTEAQKKAKENKLSIYNETINKVEKTKEKIKEGKDDFYTKSVYNDFYQAEKDKFLNPPTEKYAFNETNYKYTDNKGALKWLDYSVDKQKKKDEAKELYGFSTDYKTNKVTTFADAQKTLSFEQSKLDDLKRQLSAAQNSYIPNPSKVQELEEAIKNQEEIVGYGKEEKGEFLNKYNFADDDLKSVIRTNYDDILNTLKNNYTNIAVSSFVNKLNNITKYKTFNDLSLEEKKVVEDNLLQLAKEDKTGTVRKAILENANIENNAAINSEIVRQDAKDKVFYIPEDKNVELYKNFKDNAVASLNGGDIKVSGGNYTLNDVINNPVRHGFSSNELTTRPSVVMKSETVGNKKEADITTGDAKLNNKTGVAYSAETKNSITKEIKPSDISWEKSTTTPINLENGKGFGYYFKAKDKEGNPVYIGNKPLELILESDSPENVNRNIRELALKMKYSQKYKPNDDAVKQADEMIGVSDFSPQLDFVLKDSRKVVPAQIETKKDIYNVEVVKMAKGIQVHFAQDKTPFPLKDYNGKVITTYKNLTEFYQLLAANGF